MTPTALPYRREPRVVQTWLVLALVAAGALVVCGAIAAAAMSARFEPPPPVVTTPPTRRVTWDGAEPFRCGDGDRIDLTTPAPAEIAAGPAVIASGDCRLQILAANISAPVGIRAEGSSSVHVRGNLQVSELGIDARDRSRVRFRGVIMPFDSDRDGPSPAVGVRLRGSAHARVQATIEAVVAADLDGDTRLELRYSRIRASSDGVIARGRAHVSLLQPRLQANGVGVRILGQATGESGDRGEISGSPVAVEGGGFTPDPLTRIVDRPDR